MLDNEIMLRGYFAVFVPIVVIDVARYRVTAIRHAIEVRIID